MPIFCVSDLHLCDRGPRDNFAFEGREQRFHSFLNTVEAAQGELVILGDLFDWWQVNLSKSVVEYCDLLDRLAAMKATWVVGNHDGALVDFVGTDLMPAHPFFQRATKPFLREIGGRLFLFMHGHEGDPFNSGINPGTGEITTIISGMLEDRNKAPFDRHGHAVEDQFIGTLEGTLTLWRQLTFQAGRLDEMLDGIEAYRKNQVADVVVCGHTHEPGRIGDYHYNAGCWARQRDTYLQINSAGDVRLYEWLKGCWPSLCDDLQLR